MSGYGYTIRTDRSVHAREHPSDLLLPVHPR